MSRIFAALFFLLSLCLHAVIIFFLPLPQPGAKQEVKPPLRVMKLLDIRPLDSVPPSLKMPIHFPAEDPPLPEKPPSEPEAAPALRQSTAESGAGQPAETAAVETPAPAEAGISTETPPPDQNYLPMYRLSKPPYFSPEEIMANLAYPAAARRAGIEGMVYLELLVDSRGRVREIAVISEEPPGYGFARAAVRAFQGMKGSPAEVNGQSAPGRFRYPVRFSVK